MTGSDRPAGASREAGGPGRTCDSEAYDLVVRSRRTVTPAGERPAAVCVSGERIAAVVAYDLPVRAAAEVDLADVALLPGLVDTHVHVNEPGRADWEGFAAATRAAAAGGVTTIVDMPLNSIPPTVDPDALAVKRAAADGRCFADVGFWGGAVPGNTARLRPLHEAGVYGFKCFLSPSGVPEFPPLDPGDLRAAMTEIASFDGLLIVHAEDPDTITEPAGPGYEAFLASRPPAAERRAMAAVIELAAATGCRVHVLHLSAAGCLDQLAQARADGVRISAETCPHYLTLDAAQISAEERAAPADRPAPGGGRAAPNRFPTRYKCCPPIRDRANRERLWRGLAAGIISCVVSDHSPCPARLKRGGFDTAWGGISSLQVGLPAVWTDARERGHRLGDVVGWMAAGPARLVRMAGKGRIAPGCDADLVAFAPERVQAVEGAALHHRHPLTAYDGRTLTGVVERVWLRGRPVGERPHGRLLRRDTEPTEGMP